MEAEGGTEAMRTVYNVAHSSSALIHRRPDSLNRNSLSCCDSSVTMVRFILWAFTETYASANGLYLEYGYVCTYGYICTDISNKENKSFGTTLVSTSRKHDIAIKIR